MCIRDSLAALHRDTVGGDTAIGTLPVREQMFYIFRLYMVVRITAGGFVQLFPQHLHLISHILSLIHILKVRIVLRVGVHHQTLQQRFIIRLDEHGNKALPYPQPLGVAVCLSLIHI